MTPKRLEQIEMTARKWARVHGLEQDAEDMAQNALLRFVQDHGIKVATVCVDYMRDHYGRTGKNATEARKQDCNSKRIQLEFNEEAHGIVDQSDARANTMDLNAILSTLSDKDQDLISKYFVLGLTEVEIGREYGLSESRVSQRLKKIKDKLLISISKSDIKSYST